MYCVVSVTLCCKRFLGNSAYIKPGHGGHKALSTQAETQVQHALEVSGWSLLFHIVWLRQCRAYVYSSAAQGWMTTSDHRIQ